jgi:MFS family permease
MLLLWWGLHAHMNIAVMLVASYFVGFGISSLIPGVYSYVSCVDQVNAGSATAAVNAAWCMLSGLMVLVSGAAVDRLGVGGDFVSLCACCVGGCRRGVHSLAAVCIVLRTVRCHPRLCTIWLQCSTSCTVC